MFKCSRKLYRTLWNLQAVQDPNIMRKCLSDVVSNSNSNPVLIELPLATEHSNLEFCFYIHPGKIKLSNQLIEQLFILLQYIYLLLIVFLLEATVGGLAYVYENQITDELQQTLNTTFLQYYGVDEEKTNAIDLMQQDVKCLNSELIPNNTICITFQYTCCGALRFEDWRYSHWLKSERTDLLRLAENRLVPDSCCITMSEKCGVRDHPSNIPYTVNIYSIS